MKQTDLKEIEAEQKKYMGRVSNNKLKVDPKLEDYSGMWVEWLYPDKIAGAYDNWINAAWHACFSTWEQYPFEESKKMTFYKKEKMVLNILKDRPISAALEMPSFAFRVNGLSRALTHQFVRHRGMAFGQQSLRVTNPLAQPVRYPEWFNTLDKYAKRDILEYYRDVIATIQETYATMIYAGCPVEQARNILPIGTTTSIECSTNLKSLVDYLRARTGSIMAFLIAKEFKRVQPMFYKFVCSQVKGLDELVKSRGKGIKA